ncbi:MAG: type II secretion system protein [Acetobacterium sp.]|nr:type II secretion system protein [Acetobacterium sp.]
MELINKIRKSRKGFTLVEIIVVLIILAVLAAFTIPTMIGFVNDARDKAHIAEAREIYVAAQAATTEAVASSKAAVPAADLNEGGSNSLSGNNTGGTLAVTNKGMRKMLGDDLSEDAEWVVVVEDDGATTPAATGKVKSVTYTIPNSDPERTIIIEDGETTIS